MVVGLALTAAVCFGAQTLLVKRGLECEAARAETDAALAAATVSLAGSVAVLWALVGLRGGPVPPWSAALLPFVVAGVADPALTRLCYFEGIDRVGPSVASAITAGSPAVAALVAVVALGSTLSTAEAFGVACVAAGVTALQLGARVDVDDSTRAEDLLRRDLADAGPRDLAFPVAAAVLIAAASVVVEASLRGFSDPLVATAVTQSAALTTLLPFGVRSASARRVARRAAPATHLAFALAGLVVGVGWYAMFLALGQGSVVTVLPLVSTYPLVVVAGSYAAARERPRSPALLGAVALVVVGAAAVQAA